MARTFSSIISDHTAEYALVPALVEILRTKYETVAPLYLWLSREGGRLARNIHENEEFRAVALFPRRPKSKGGNQATLTMTISNQMLAAAEVLQTRGIPSVAGCPVVTSFWQILSNPPCLFSRLGPSVDMEYTFDTSGAPICTYDSLLNSSAELVQYVRQASNDLNLESLVDAVRGSRGPRHSVEGIGAHMFSAGYKPVIILLRKNN